MPSQSNRPVFLEFRVSTSHPELLMGLEAWLSLGLLSESQVRDLCSRHLSCPLPEPIMAPTGVEAPRKLPVSALSATDFSEREVPPQPLLSPRPPNFLNQALHSLMAELSVVWLLFLGVFLVVISSGVLAASQWQRFSATGQYGVLLGYTLTFWGISNWATGQRNLQLTAQTLRLVTLLLIPVNFWAMDTFGLWQSPANWIVAIGGAIVLTPIGWTLIKQELQAPLLAVNHLWLSYLHWGWRLSGWALVAVYLGTVGTVICAFYQIRQQRDRETEEEADRFSLRSGRFPSRKVGLVVYALGILLGRAIFVKGVEISQLGLAMGICGALLAWLDWQQPEGLRSLPRPVSQPHLATILNWEVIAGILLGLGWLVSVEKFPGQALAVSGLAIWYFSNRLVRLWKEIDLAMLFAVGLQGIWLGWRLIPETLQTQAIAVLTQLTNSQTTPWALLGLVLFPYLMLAVIITQWLHRQRQPKLARFGEVMTLGFGVFLSTLSYVNPLLRTLNLFASTLTLGWVTRQYIARDRSPTEASTSLSSDTPTCIYLTHLTGLLTLVSVIDFWFPTLSPETWAAILLGLMVAEWTFSIGGKNRSVPLHNVVLQSAWDLGLGLAGLSFLLLMNTCYDRAAFNQPRYLTGCLIWLVTPLALTTVARYTDRQQRQIAIDLSTATLLAAQVLTIGTSGNRLIGLGIATGLMFVNTQFRQQLSMATIAVGFGLGFLGASLWEGVGLTQESVAVWFLAMAIATASFWLLRTSLIRDRTPREVSEAEDPGISPPAPLRFLYAQALDSWAIALCSVLLVWLTLYSWELYSGFDSKIFSPSFTAILATGILMVAIAFRSYQNPSAWGLYSLAWGLELLAAETIGWVGRETIDLAIANIILGLGAQLLGDWWKQKNPHHRMLPSLHAIPLLYGALGAVLRSHVFTSWTSLTSLGISFIAIGIGKRQTEFKPLTYLGLIGVSFSAYEWLLYQLLQSSGGGLGNGLIIMASLGAGIMYAYQILLPWLVHFLNLSRSELKAIVHLHWIVSSLFLLAATLFPIKSGLWLGLGIGACLVQYAIFQGRRNPNQTWGETWVYLGFIEAIAIRLYWLSTPVARFIGGPLFLWKTAIASLFAYFLYILPWEDWGWSKQPWKVGAFLIPLIALVESRGIFHPLSLLIAAGFYIFLAWDNQQIRFTYISAAFIDWVILDWLFQSRFLQPEWYTVPLGLSILYVAQVDPAFQSRDGREMRHVIRVLGIIAICGVPLLTQNGYGLVAAFLSLVAIFAGLSLRVRAFLYAGTAIFLINAFYQLVILIFDYPSIKWVIGLGFGVVFIWIAATFETRRDRLISFVEYWIDQLASWE